MRAVRLSSKDTRDGSRAETPLTRLFSVYTKNEMRIPFDPAKRIRTLAERSLDFADAGAVFAGRHFTRAGERRAYDEPRYVTAGLLSGRVVILVWTPRTSGRRIISMRRANDREKTLFKKRLD